MSDIVAKIRAEKNSNIDTLILEASNVEISNNIGLIIPVGTTLERESVTPRQGTIRYNSTDTAFEGYDGTNWGTLGGVKDVSQTTFIRAEEFPSANNKQLDFFTDNNHIMRLDVNGDLLLGPDISNNNISITMDNNSGTINLHKLNIVNENDNTKQFSIDISDNNKTIINSTTGAVTVFNNSVEFKVAPTFPAGEGAATTQNIGGGRIYNTIIGYNNLGTETGEKSFFTTTKSQQLIIEDKINFYDSAATSYNYPLLSAHFDSIEISSNAVINGTLTVNNNLDIGDTLNVERNASFNNNVDISGTLNVKRDASFNNNVEISGALNIKGDTSLNNLDISGTIKLPYSSNNGYGLSGEVLKSQGINSPPIWQNVGDFLSTTATDKQFLSSDLQLSNNVDICGNLDVSSVTTSTIITSTITATEGNFTNGTIPLKIGQNSIHGDAKDRNVYIYKNQMGKLIFGHGTFIQGDVDHNGPPEIALRDGRAGNIYFTGYVSPTSHSSTNYYPQIWNGPSDDRLKHNEIIIQNGLDIIRQLIPQKYQKTNEMKDANFKGELEEGSWKWEAGVIAQDVEKVKGLEYLVGAGGFPSEEDVKNGVVYKEYPKTVVYNDLFVYNIAATKELDTIVQNQKTEINDLKNENNNLKNENNDLKNQLNVIKSALNELLIASGKNTI